MYVITYICSATIISKTRLPSKNLSVWKILLNNSQNFLSSIWFDKYKKKLWSFRVLNNSLILLNLYFKETLSLYIISYRNHRSLMKLLKKGINFPHWRYVDEMKTETKQRKKYKERHIILHRKLNASNMNSVKIMGLYRDVPEERRTFKRKIVNH